MNKENMDYHELNALLNLVGDGGKLQLDADKESVRKYFVDHVNQNTVFFHNLEEKLEYLVDEGYYEKEVLDQYDFDFIKYVYKHAYSKKFRFKTFLGAYKYYNQYTLKTFDGKRYLERYEDRISMVALYLARGDKKMAISLVDEIISGRFQPATPTFLNAGKKQRGELVSCFLMLTSDTLESIGRSVNSALQLSKRGGGVALNLTNLREAGAPIKKIENQSTGVIPVMKILEDSFSYANQLGSRQGAGAVYLHAHHPDIMKFLDTKRENADEKIRIKTLSLGVVIPDITFELARNDDMMYLFSPYDIERIYGKTFTEIDISEKYHEMVNNPDIRKGKIKAREFFKTIAELQFESGYPYIMFEDNVNKEHNLDGKINMSNLCVHGDTTILTDKGHVAISDVVGTKQNVWNGEEWSSVDVVKTGEDQKLVSVTLSDGSELKCTPEHKFYISDASGDTVEVRAKDLVHGQELIKLETPVIDGMLTLNGAYTSGLLENGGDKEFVPCASYSIESRLKWFIGLCDTNASIIDVDGKYNVLEISSPSKEFLIKVKLMLQTLGVQSDVNMGGKHPRIIIYNDGIQALLDIGFETYTSRLDYSNVNLDIGSERFVTVVGVEEIDGLHDTFCFTEPKRHMGVFNGILTGQCSEILQRNKESVYEEDLSYKKVGEDISCNLGSLNIAMALESPDFGKTVETSIRALTAVSDLSNIKCVPSIANGNSKSHSIGLGQMNLHGMLSREKIFYGSEESIDFTNIYFYTVAYHCVRSSNKIAIERGEKFSEFEKSKYASGEYFDKYVDQEWKPITKKVASIFKKYDIEIPTQKDWEKLKRSVMKHGMYNAYLQAVPPTGSISYINNSTSSVHPIAAKVEIRKEGKLGRVYYPAPFLTNDNLEYYQDAYEIGYEKIIDVYAAAQQHVDQGMSLTLFFPDTATTRDINKAQIYAWKKGIKTLYYIRVRQKALAGTEIDGCVSCSL